MLPERMWGVGGMGVGGATYGTFLSQIRLLYQEENSEYMAEFEA